MRIVLLLQFIRRTIIIKEKLLLGVSLIKTQDAIKHFYFQRKHKKLAVFLYLAKQTNLDLSSVARKFDLSTKIYQFIFVKFKKT